MSDSQFETMALYRTSRRGKIASSCAFATHRKSQITKGISGSTDQEIQYPDWLRIKLWPRLRRQELRSGGKIFAIGDFEIRNAVFDQLDRYL